MYITPIAFANFVDDICSMPILKKGTEIKYIYGIPRGGVNVAIAISQQTEIPLIDELPAKGSKEILVVDDIIDSGTTRKKYKQFPFYALILKNHADLKYIKNTYCGIKIPAEWVTFFWEKEDKVGETLVLPIEENIIRILEYIGEDPNRVGLRDTPKRVVKMYEEMFRGYNEKEKPNITVFPNGQDGVQYDEMIIDSGYFFSHCEHHMVPFFGTYNFGYIPDKQILGASKISRIVDYHAARLQVAERLGQMVINELYNACKPLGMILVMRGRHLCKEMRGVKKWNSPFEVINTLGIFRENKNGCKDEFINRIKISNDR